MSGGGNTSTTTSGPPPQVIQAYMNSIQRATDVAGAPLQQYQGNIVAPLNAEQNAGINGINNVAQQSAPYLQSASNFIGASTTPLLPSIQGYLNEAKDAYQYGSSADFGGALAPYANAASNVYGQAGNGITFNPVTAAQIAQYQSPYTQQVVDATQAQFNNQNAQQMQGVRGNAISQGAFGGDREAVAEGITAGQQQLAQAPVIAGLYNQGYSQALGEANTQQQAQMQQQIARQQAQLSGAQGMAGLGGQNLAATQAAAQAQFQAAQGIGGLGQTALGANEANAWLSSQAGYGLANLGNELYQQNMGQAQGMLGAGGLQQQVEQENLNVPYQQFLAQQAYPFQTTGWLANISEGLGGGMGGNSSTTTPGPSVGSQIAGAGLTGASILGMTGAFGNNGWMTGGGGGAGGFIDSGAFDVQRGGGIPHRAGGGPIGIGTGPIGISTGTPDLSVSIVPQSTMSGRHGMIQGPMQPVTTNTQSGSGDSTFGSILKGAGTIAAGIYGGPGGALAAQALGSQVHFAQGGGIVSFPHHLARMPGTGNRGITANDNMHLGPHAPRRLAAGGASDMDFADADFEAPGGITGNGPFALDNPDAGLPVPPIPPRHGGIVTHARAAATSSEGLPVPPIPPVQDSGAGIVAAAPAPVMQADVRQGIAPAAESAPTHSAPQNNRAPWETLLAAGLGIMGGTSPHALVNIGRGAMQGLAYSDQQRLRQEQQALARLTQEETAKYHSGELDLRGKQLEQTGELTRAQMAQKQAYEQAAMAQQLQIAKMHIGLEGARLAEEKAFHQQSLTPPELRIFNEFSKMSPEDQAHFTQLNMAQKGIPDIAGGAIPPIAPPAATEGGGSGGADTAAPVTAAPTRNEQYLSSLDPKYQPMVKALAEGRMAMPTRPSPLQQQLIAAASQYDPTFDATDFNKRSGTAKDFASGQSAKAVTAINTATAHLSSLSDQMQALHNGDIPLVNSISNWIKTNTGKSAPTTATETRDAVANELRKVFATTGGGGLEELKDWQSHFPVNGSPAQQRDAIHQAIELMQPRMESLAHQWNTGMGTNHEGLDLLSPSARDSWKKLTGSVPPVAAAPTPTFNRPGGATTQRPMEAPIEPTIPRMNSPAEAAKLPSGTRFLDPNGIMRTVP